MAGEGEEGSGLHRGGDPRPGEAPPRDVREDLAAVTRAAVVDLGGPDPPGGLEGGARPGGTRGRLPGGGTALGGRRAGGAHRPGGRRAGVTEGAGGVEAEVAPLREEAAPPRGVEARLRGEMALLPAARPPAQPRTGHPLKTTCPHPLPPSPLDSLTTAGPRLPSVSASPHAAKARGFLDRLATAA